MSEKPATLTDVAEAIRDLSRITLAVSGKFASKSDAIRQLSDLAIPPSRIAAILATPLPNVTSAIAKARKGARLADSSDQTDDTMGA